jgi:hypothetical protein
LGANFSLSHSYLNKIDKEEERVQLTVKGPTDELSGSLWNYLNREKEETEGVQVQLNTTLLDQLRAAMDTQLDNAQFTFFLLCVAEAESGGGMNGAVDEMENLHFYNLFGAANQSASTIVTMFRSS